MRTLNRASWAVIGIAVLSLVMAIVLVVGASVLVHANLSVPAVWAAIAALIGYRFLTDGAGAEATPPARPSAPPPPPSEPEISLDDLKKLRDLWLQGDLPTDVYRRAAAKVARRYNPPPAPAPQRRRWWQ